MNQDYILISPSVQHSFWKYYWIHYELHKFQLNNRICKISIAKVFDNYVPTYVESRSRISGLTTAKPWSECLNLEPSRMAFMKASKSCIPQWRYLLWSSIGETLFLLNTSMRLKCQFDTWQLNNYYNTWQLIYQCYTLQTNSAFLDAWIFGKVLLHGLLIFGTQ